MGLPVVLVTHDREEALALGDRVAVIDEGRVTAQGDPVTLLGHPPRERVARLAGVENLLRLKIEEVRPAEGLLTCRRGDFRLETPLSEAEPGDEVVIGLRADDILLATQRPRGLSARNTIPATVTSILSKGALYEVEVECRGTRLVSHVTRGALDELALAPGAEVWVVVKTSSLMVFAEEVMETLPERG